LKVRYLIIRFSSIGDIVLTSPVTRCLKQQLEDVEIHFVTKQKFASLVAHNPHIDKVHLYSGNMEELISELKAENFNYIIDLHNNFRSNWIKIQLKKPSITFKKLNLQKFLLVNLKINLLPDKHIVDRYLDTVKKLGVTNDLKGLDYFIPEQEAFSMNHLPEPFRGGFVSFVIGSAWYTKKLPVEKIVEIINKLNHPVVLLGGKDEYQNGESILQKTGGKVINLAGKLTLNQSASLVRDSRLVLTNDTGLMHIAASFKKKILSFWGNTVPLFGMTPYRADPASLLMEVQGLGCRPCSKIGRRACPKGHFKCMLDQDIEKAIQWVKKEY